MVQSRWLISPPGGHPTRVTSSGAVVLIATGRLNYSASTALRHQLHSLIEAGHSRVVVDLSGALSVDSSGIGALISALKRARNAGGDLRLTSPNAHVMKVLEQTNLRHILVVYGDADAAFEQPA